MRSTVYYREILSEKKKKKRADQKYVDNSSIVLNAKENSKIISVSIGIANPTNFSLEIRVWITELIRNRS